MHHFLKFILDEKNVVFFQNKFEKMVHLVGLL
jgi:hypothetical protein